MNSHKQSVNPRSCAKMEIIEKYGLTLADINNLVRHAVSAAGDITEPLAGTPQSRKNQGKIPKVGEPPAQQVKT